MSARTQTAGAVATDRIVPGVLLMLGFTVTIPISDSMSKIAGAVVPVAQILAVRFVVQALVLIPMARRRGAFPRPDAREVGAHVVRAVLVVAATGTLVSAIIAMPLADAIAIFFVEPFLLTLLGAIFLGEAVGARRLAACGAGFAGALLVIRPSFAAFGPVALLPVVAALAFAVYIIMTRGMARRIHPVALQGYLALGALAVLLPVLAVGALTGAALIEPVLPGPRDALLLLGVGVFATTAHLMMTYALRLAPAATLAPLQYFEVVAATVVGYLVFADLPDAQSLLGIAIIVGAGLYIFLRERALERPPPRTA